MGTSQGTWHLVYAAMGQGAYYYRFIVAIRQFVHGRANRQPEAVQLTGVQCRLCHWSSHQPCGLVAPYGLNHSTSV